MCRCPSSSSIVTDSTAERASASAARPGCVSVALGEVAEGADGSEGGRGGEGVARVIGRSNSSSMEGRNRKEDMVTVWEMVLEKGGMRSEILCFE